MGIPGTPQAGGGVIAPFLGLRAKKDAKIIVRIIIIIINKRSF